MNKEPSRRYPDARAMLDALKDARKRLDEPAPQSAAELALNASLIPAC